MRAPLPASRWAALWQSLPLLLAIVIAMASPVAMAARAKGHPILRQWAAAYAAPYTKTDQAASLSWSAPAGVAGSAILLQDRDPEEDAQGMEAISDLGGRQFTDPSPAIMNGTPLDRGSILNSLYLSTDPMVVTSGFFPMRKLVEQMSVWMIFPLIILSILVGVTRGSPDQEMVMGAKRLLMVMVLLWAYPLWDIVLTRGIAFPVAKMLSSPEIRDVFLVQEAQRRGIGTGAGTAEAKRDTLRMFLYGRSVALDSSVRANGNLTRGVPDSLKPSHWGTMSNYYNNDLNCAVRLAGEGLGGDPVVAVDSSKVRTISSTGSPTTRRSLARDPREVQIRDLAALQPDFRQKINQLVMVLERRGFQVLVTETLRPQARQEWLYEQGRTRPGPVVTGTLNSNHRSGYATDFKLNNTWNPAPYLEMRRVAAAIPGLGWLPDRNGAMNDGPHIEMVGRYRQRLTVDPSQVTSNKRTPGTTVRTAAGNEAVVADGNNPASGAAQSVEEAGLYRCIGDETPGFMHGMHTVSWVGLSTKQLDNKEQVVDRIQSGWKGPIMAKFTAVKTFIAGAASSITTGVKWGFGLMKAFITGDWSAVAEMILEAFLGIVMQLVNFLTAALMWFLWLRMVLSRVVSLTFAPFALAMGIRGQGLIPEGTKRWFKGHAEICLQPVGLALVSLVFFMMTTLIHSDRTFLGPQASLPTGTATMVASAGPAGGSVLLAAVQTPPAPPRDTVITLPQGFNPRDINVTQIDSLRFDPQQRGLLRDIPTDPLEVKKIPVTLRFAIAVILVFLALSADKISKALAGEIGQIGKVVGNIVEGRARQTAFLAARLTAEAGAAVLTGGASVARAAAAEVAKQGMKGIAKEGLKSVAKAGVKAGGKELGQQVKGAAKKGFRRVATGVLGAAVGGAGMVMSREEAEEQGLLGDRPTMGQQERTDALSAFEQTERQLQAEFGTRGPTRTAAPSSLTGAPAPTWDAAMLLEGMGAAEAPTWSVAPDLAGAGPSASAEGAAAVAGLGGWLAARGALPATRAQSIERVLDGRLDINRVVDMLLALPPQRQAEILATVKRGSPSANPSSDTPSGALGAAEWKELLGRQGASVLGAAPEVLGAAQWERGTGALIGEAMRSYPEWAAALSQMAPDGRWEELVQGGLLADGETWLSAGVGRERKLGALGIGADDPLRNLLQSLDPGTFTALTQGAGNRDAIKTRVLDLVVPVVAQQSGAGQAESIEVLLERLNSSVPAGSAQRPMVEALIQVQRGAATGASLSPAMWAGLGAVAVGAQATQRVRMQQVVQRTAEAGALGFDIAAWQSSGGRTEAYRASAQSALAMVAQADSTLPVDLQFAVATQALENVTGRAAVEGAALQALSADQLSAVKAAITEQVLPQAQLAALGTSPQELMKAIGATDLTRLGAAVPLREGSLAAGVLGASAATAVDVGAALPQLVGQALSQPTVREEVRAAIANGVSPVEAVLAATGVASQARGTSGAAMEQLLTLTTQADAAISQAAQSVIDTARPQGAPVTEQPGGEITIVATQTGFGVAQAVRFEERLAQAFSLAPEGSSTDEGVVAVMEAAEGGTSSVPTGGTRAAVGSQLINAEPVSTSASVAARFEAAGVLENDQSLTPSGGSPSEGRDAVMSTGAPQQASQGEVPVSGNPSSPQTPPVTNAGQRAAEAFNEAVELTQASSAGGPVPAENGAETGVPQLDQEITGGGRDALDNETLQTATKTGEVSNRRFGEVAPSGAVRESMTPGSETGVSPDGRLANQNAGGSSAAASFEEAEKIVAGKGRESSGVAAERMADTASPTNSTQGPPPLERGAPAEATRASALDTTGAMVPPLVVGAAGLASEKRPEDAWTEATRAVSAPQERAAVEPQEGPGEPSGDTGRAQRVSATPSSTPQQEMLGAREESAGAQAAKTPGTGAVNPWDQALEAVSPELSAPGASPIEGIGQTPKASSAPRPPAEGLAARPSGSVPPRSGAFEEQRMAEGRAQDPSVTAFESAEAALGTGERPVEKVTAGRQTSQATPTIQEARADGVARPAVVEQERMSASPVSGGGEGSVTREAADLQGSARESKAPAEASRTQTETRGAREVDASPLGGERPTLRDAVSAAFAASAQPSSAPQETTSEQSAGRESGTSRASDQGRPENQGAQRAPEPRTAASAAPAGSPDSTQASPATRAAAAIESFAAASPQVGPARAPEQPPSAPVERAASAIDSFAAAGTQATQTRASETTQEAPAERTAAPRETAAVTSQLSAPARALEQTPSGPVERAAAAIDSFAAAGTQANQTRASETTQAAPAERTATQRETATVTSQQSAPARAPEQAPATPVERAAAPSESVAAASPQATPARAPEPTPVAPVERAAAPSESVAAASPQATPARAPEPTPVAPVERGAAPSESVSATSPQATPARAPEPTPVAPVEQGAAPSESVAAASPQATPARAPEPTPVAPVERGAAPSESVAATSPQATPARAPEPTPVAPVERGAAPSESVAATSPQATPGRAPEPTPVAPAERAAAPSESVAATSPQATPARAPEPTPVAPAERAAAPSESAAATSPQATPARAPEPTPVAPAERAAAPIESVAATSPQATPARAPEPTPVAPSERAAAPIESVAATSPQATPARASEPTSASPVERASVGESGGAEREKREAAGDETSQTPAPITEGSQTSSQERQGEGQPVPEVATQKSGVSKGGREEDKLPAPPTGVPTSAAAASNDRLGLSTGFIEFQAASGSALPLSERIRITSPTGARLQIEAVQYEGEASGWLEAKGNDPVRPTAVTVTADLREVPPGVHRASIQVTNQQPGGGAVLLQVVLTVDEGAQTPQNLLQKTVGHLAHEASELAYNRGMKPESSGKIRQELDEVLGQGRALIEYGQSDSVPARKQRAWRMREAIRSTDRIIAGVLEEEETAVTGRSPLDRIRRILRDLDKQVVAILS